MLQRRPIFPGVIEMNYQAGWRIGCNVYLVHDDRDWGLIDIGYTESVDEIIEMIRQSMSKALPKPRVFSRHL